ncbi:MAG: DUF1015 family protein [Oscillospiraceae bacterium]|nr:DUF1015 family protein [Oscillospiraceae bacterium]
MAVFRPFRAIRPAPLYAAAVAALPYDTMSSAEARERVRGNPYSFLHVDKAEIDLPEGIDLYADAVYQTAAANLSRMCADGIFVQDAENCFYIYQQTWRGRTQTGLVGCASIDDYKNNIIKKHELTHPDKETDRIRHVTACNANTGPIFLMYRDSQGTADLLERWKSEHTSVCAFTDSAGVAQQIWVVDDAAYIDALKNRFAATDSLYIADGHHRCASAYRVGMRKRGAAGEAYDPNAAYNYFLAVAFPENQLQIMDYNRVVRDLNGLTTESFLAKLQDLFAVEIVGKTGEPYHPENTHYFGMYLDGVWYRCRARRGLFDADDPVARLDVEILQKNVLAPLLGIQDPRRDKRIAFVGGIRGLEELERRCRTDMKIAFAMYATTTRELMDIADSGNIMPPKSTWFEPKLLSGLFVHDLEG